MLDDDRRSNSTGDLLGGLVAAVFFVAVLRLLVQNWRLTLVTAAGVAVVFFGLAGIGYAWDATGIRDVWFWPLVLTLAIPLVAWRIRAAHIRHTQYRAARAKHAERMRRIRLGLPEE